MKTLALILIALVSAHAESSFKLGEPMTYSDGKKRDIQDLDPTPLTKEQIEERKTKARVVGKIIKVYPDGVLILAEPFHIYASHYNSNGNGTESRAPIPKDDPNRPGRMTGKVFVYCPTLGVADGDERDVDVYVLTSATISKDGHTYHCCSTQNPAVPISSEARPNNP